MKGNGRIPETGAEKLTMYQCLCYVLLTETSSCQVPFANLIVLNTTKSKYYLKISSLSLHFLVVFVCSRAKLSNGSEVKELMTNILLHKIIFFPFPNKNLVEIIFNPMIIINKSKTISVKMLVYNIYSI